MFWKSISLENYLPFGHSGIKKVSINFVQEITAYLGTNGCGKTSLLRAMTPYPSVRTDFGPKGKIVKVLEHDGHIFELTSDFSNAAAPHSFKKDDQELNISGTTEAQKDLIEEHLGITKLFDDILAGNIKICSTRTAERRALFSATYPGDLSFVIEYHKKVCSQIRACGNQLKLLKGREASLRSSLLDRAERQRLEYFKVAAEDMVNRLEKGQLLLEAELQRWKQLPRPKDDCHYSYDGWDVLDARDEVLLLGDDIIRGFRRTGVRKRLHDEFNSDSIAAQASRYFDTAKNIQYQIDRTTNNVEEIKKELEKFIQARNANASANEKTQLEERFKVCQRDLEEVNQKIGLDLSGLVDADAVDEIEGTILPYVRTWVESIHSSTGSIFTQKEVLDLEIKLANAQMALTSNIRNELATVTAEIQTYSSKLQKLESRPYPKDCVQVCPLRSSVEESIEATRTRLNELIEHKRVLNEQIKETTEFITKNQPIYDEQRNLHGSIESMIKTLRPHNLDTIAFNGEDPICCCNTHCYEIGNRIANACSNTRLHMQKQHLTNEMESIRQTLSTMASTKQLQMSVDLINQTIADREEKLNVGIQEIINLEDAKVEAETKGNEIQKIADNYRNLEFRVRDANLLLNQERCDMFVKWLEDILKELVPLTTELREEIFNVSKTLQEQQKNIDILESEILPTMTKVEHDKSVYEAVADGLSPTSGLPCIYLIRFINRLMTRANEIIRNVWMYNMELMYLKEEDNLDFKIKVILRNNSVVEDVGMLSLGQQAIVNLAMTLALCQERGLLSWNALRLDEVDGALTDEHRTRLVSLINKLVDDGEIKQLFLVNHFAIQTGMSKCDSVVLGEEGICVPERYNEHAIVE